MKELDILNLFYEEIKARGETRESVFLSIDENTAGILAQKLKEPVSLEEVQRVTDICIANEWLERTTADLEYNYLSLTGAGLQIVLAAEYR